MYPFPEKQLPLFVDFYLPFGGRLRADNRWVKLANIIPWDEIEEKYASLFTEGKGVPAKSVRMALGVLIIKEKCGYSDRETVEQIMETPYLQYFIGLKGFQFDAPFDPSLMVHFRKRLGLETMKQINELICQTQSSNNKLEKDDNDSDDEQKPGKPQNDPNQFKRNSLTFV